MKKFAGIISIAASLLFANNAVAQQVGTIGVGDISYAAKDSKLRAKENIISALDSGINAALIKTRKFTVLDYAQLEKRLSDQNLNLEGYYSNKYQQEGTYDQIGLDYILTANVTDFDVIKQKRGKSDWSVALLDLDYKLYGVADVTQDSSASISAQLSSKGVSDDEAVQDLLDKTISRAVEQLTQHLISGLFPIRVLKVNEDNSIVLNYGEGLLAPGDTVLIYPKDAKIILDESGEVIGDSIATLQITSAAKKFATAQILDGKDVIETGQQGQVLRVGG